MLSLCIVLFDFSVAGVLTFTPASIDEMRLEVGVSDGTANTSLAFKTHVCSCLNEGACDWNSTTEGAVFAVSTKEYKAL